jgi:putative toxin-antitoxin system antitoxin component (TIGR02293 family)
MKTIEDKQSATTQPRTKPALASAKAKVVRASVKSWRYEINYLQMFKASPSEQIDIIRKGLPAELLTRTVWDMGMPKERIFTVLKFPRTTINRQITKNEPLSPEFSERTLGLQKLIGQVESIMADSGADPDFNAAHWVAHWLEQPLPALNNARPADYMDTVVGQELVASMLARTQSGAYA